MLKLVIYIYIFLELIEIIMYQINNPMLPYFIMVFILVESICNLGIFFKKEVANFWLKKIINNNTLYFLENLLSFQCIRKIIFFKFQFELINIAMHLFNTLKNSTFNALNTIYKEFLFKFFFSNLALAYADELPSVNKFYLNNKNYENINIKETVPADAPSVEDRILEELSNSLSGTIVPKEKIEITFKWKKPFYNVLNWYRLQDPLKKPPFIYPKRATFDHSTWDGIFDSLLWFYRRARNRGWEDEKEVLEMLKPLNFEKTIAKAPIFYDIRTNSFYVNDLTKYYYEVAFGQLEEEYGYDRFDDADNEKMVAIVNQEIKELNEAFDEYFEEYPIDPFTNRLF